MRFRSRSTSCEHMCIREGGQRPNFLVVVIKLMDDPGDKPERRSGTYYFPGTFRYFLIYVYTTGNESGCPEGGLRGDATLPIRQKQQMTEFIRPSDADHHRRTEAESFQG